MPRPTVRLRMTLLYAGVFFVAGALLLSVSYALVRNNLTDPANLRNPIQRYVGGLGRWGYKEQDRP